MSKLKLTEVLDDKPVRLTVELEPRLHHDLTAYAEALGRQSGQAVEPSELGAPMRLHVPTSRNSGAGEGISLVALAVVAGSS